MDAHQMEKSPRCTVSFRIIGDNLEPSKITMLLGLEPDIAHKKGDPNIGTSKKGKKINYSPFNTGLWTIESNLPKDRSLQEHIICILDLLEPVKDMLDKLSNEGFKLDLYCGYFFSSHEQAGISLNRNVLKQISRLGVDLGISFYII